MANFNATTGTDTNTQSPGDDTLTVTSTSQIQGTDFFDGAAGTDAIVIGSGGDGVSIDFTGLGTDATHGLHNYEALTFTNASGTSTVTLNSGQFGDGLISNTMAIAATSALQGIVINVAPGSTFSAAGWTFTDWDSATDTIYFTTGFGADAVTGSSQADKIDMSAGDSFSGLGGSDIVNAFWTGFGSSALTTIDGGADDDEITLITVGLFTGTIEGGAGNDSLLVKPFSTQTEVSISGLTVTGVETLYCQIVTLGTPDQFEAFDHIALEPGSTETHVQITLNGAGTADLADELDGVNASFHPWSGGNTIISGNGNDIFAGGSSTTFFGGAGNDTYNAGGGVGTGNTAGFNGNWLDYTISLDGSTYTLIDNVGSDGTDEVSSFANYQFSNGTFSLTQVLNDAPTDISLSSNTVAEGASNGTLVGTLGATDADTPLGDTATFTLLDDAGGRFGLSGDTIVVANGGLLDFEDDASLAITVRVTDAKGLTFDKIVTINLTNVNESPAVANAIADQEIDEDAAWNFQFPADTFSDPDDGDAFTYSATLGNGNPLPPWLSFNPATRTFSGTPPANFNGQVDVKVTANDGAETISDTFRLTVDPVNDAPSITSNGAGSTAAVIRAENTKPVTTVAATDVDAGDSLTYAIVGGADAGKFAINGATGALAFLAAPDFEVPKDANHDNRYIVTVRVSDGTASDTQTITVRVTDVNGVTINGTNSNDVIDAKHTVGKKFPTNEEDVLRGKGGNDKMAALGGDDTLDGGLGRDTLTGGSGRDAFLFNAKLGPTNVDRITDFSVVDDMIHLDNAVFVALDAAGALGGAKFFKGAAAHDANDRIIYNAVTGALIYDSNGNAAGGAIQFAMLKTGLALTAADFLIV